DLLPGYHPVADSGKFHEEWGGGPQAPGLTLQEMVESARSGKLKALYVVGADVRKLVPFGRGEAADMGQSRGAQSGEADRHSVWLEAHGLEPKMSPFDPMAILDEIQRLVPGYNVSRMNLLAGNSEHTSLAQAGPSTAHKPGAISPANDSLF